MPARQVPPHRPTGADFSILPRIQKIWPLPWYSLLSIGEMTFAYILSLDFSLAYTYPGAQDDAEEVTTPLLAVLHKR